MASLSNFKGKLHVMTRTKVKSTGVVESPAAVFGFHEQVRPGIHYLIQVFDLAQGTPGAVTLINIL